MKYLKKYEDSEHKYNIPAKYNVGDYVYLKKLESFDNPILPVPYAKILFIETYKYYIPDYKVEVLNKNNEIFDIYPVDELDIKRYMSDEEIEEFKGLKISTKYNL